jgi:hypothetical protein
MSPGTCVGRLAETPSRQLLLRCSTSCIHAVVPLEKASAVLFMFIAIVMHGGGNRGNHAFIEAARIHAGG